MFKNSSLGIIKEFKPKNPWFSNIFFLLTDYTPKVKIYEQCKQAQYPDIREQTEKAFRGWGFLSRKNCRSWRKLSTSTVKSKGPDLRLAREKWSDLQAKPACEDQNHSFMKERQRFLHKMGPSLRWQKQGTFKDQGKISLVKSKTENKRKGEPR